ncbi:MAG: hypothetical protein QOD84_2803 [Acidobacteriaceae bacterium]|jgi:flavin-dependent dehydrogenase
MFDLIVVGAGPAGASAAISATRLGAKVMLLDSAAFPRQKVCGEFVSAESLELLETLLNGSNQALLHDAPRIPQTRIFVDGRKIETPIGSPAASIARVDMDLALWQSAEKCGVDTRQQTKVNKIEGSGPFHLLTSGGEFEARAVINSSGRWSNLNAARDLPAASSGNSHEKWLGIKAHFSEASPPCSVDLYFFEGGYCGVQPVNVLGTESSTGRVNACAMVKASVASTLTDVFAQHPALAERAQSWQILTQPVTTSPLIFRQPRPEAGGVLMAGDAAGFVDPFVGDGISLALRSGRLAAENLAPFFRNQVLLAEAVRSYRDAYQQRLSPIFATSSKIRLMLTLPKPIRVPMLMFLEKTPAITRYMVSKTR